MRSQSNQQKIRILFLSVCLCLLRFSYASAQLHTSHEVRIGARLLLEEYESSSIIYAGWHPVGKAKTSLRPFVNLGAGMHDPYDEVYDPNDFVPRPSFPVCYWEIGVQTAFQSKYIIVRNHTGISRIWSPQGKMKSFTCFTTGFSLGTGKLFKRVDLSFDAIGIELDLSSRDYGALTTGFSLGYTFGNKH